MHAYVNGTLLHTNACGCAVGNLIAHALGYRIEISPSLKMPIWDSHGTRVTQHWYNHLYSPKSLGDFEEFEAINQLDATGYTEEEIRRIEEAFEKDWDNDCVLPANLPDDGSGLKRVMAVLYDIHKGEADQITEAWVDSVIGPLKQRELDILLSVKGLPPVSQQ